MLATAEGKDKIRHAQDRLAGWVSDWLKLVSEEDATKLLDNLVWLNAQAK